MYLQKWTDPVEYVAEAIKLHLKDPGQQTPLHSLKCAKELSILEEELKIGIIHHNI